MLITNKASKNIAWYVIVFKAIRSFTKSPFKPIPVKFPPKYFFITVISTILLWTLLLSAIIYRNSHKDDIGQLADLLFFEGRREKHSLRIAVKTFLLAPYNWISSNLNAEETPHIYIDIKFKHYQKLIKKREEALAQGFLVTTPDSYIPAKIQHEGSTYKIKLRLKGDLPDHWQGDKWSFRIHMKGKNHIFGIRRFSLQDPKTREFEGEAIFFEALRREGILAPRYFFVDLTVNGKYKGVMAFEEHFSKELLERQGRKESVILKFDESHMALDRNGPFESYKNSPIAPFRYNKIKKSEVLSRDLETATGLLRGFADETLSSSQVFDVELMGRYLAVASVWGAWHPTRWHNIRFYYNPITAKLEPIGYDAYLRYFKRVSVEPSKYPITAAMLESDLAIRPIYEATIKRLKEEAENRVLEDWVRPLQERSLRVLHKEYPLLGGINLFGMAEAASEALKRSEAAHGRYNKILSANLIEDEKGRYLELVNHIPQKIFITNIERVNRKTEQQIPLSIATSQAYPFSLPRTPAKTSPRTKKIYLKEVDESQDSKFLVTAHVEGDDKKWIVEDTPYFPVIKNSIFPSISLKQALKHHHFLNHDLNSNSITIERGHWIVNEPLIIPLGMSLTFPKGTTLEFKSRSGLISTGPVYINGTLDEPVILRGSDAESGNNHWQGIAIINSREPSVWSNVEIENTTGISMHRWLLSGGVNFYESNIKMDHVLFNGNRSEDALNIVRSKFELNNITIKNTTSDAFDSDFSKGSVANSVFENIGSQGGGDGIDVSGSEVTVTQSIFDNISDKALSVGESSIMKASGLIIKNVNIGVASKDGSQLFITDSKITGTKKAGLMAYIKKSEYGPAKITADALEFSSIEKRAISQEGNKILIDGVDVSPENLRVKELYSTTSKL
jgi:hypothetical protein